MKIENVTFSGKEAEPLSLHELEEAYKLLEPAGEPVICGVTQNLTKEKFDLLFPEKKEASNAIDMLYGLRVIKRSYVPLNELWFTDKDGKVVRKFSV